MTDRPDLQHVTLSQSELDKMHAEISAEIADRLGKPPTMATLTASGDVPPETWTSRQLQRIDSFGRVLTLFVAEFVQSVAALIIAVVFGVLEFQRVYHGSIALGQSDANSNWIAIAIVSANFIVPIYVLKSLRGTDSRYIVRPTVKSMLIGIRRRILGDAERVPVDWTYNPTLKASKIVITYTTIFLAVYDVLSPVLISILTGSASAPMEILVIQLIIGLGLSIGGVYFLQSAAHEIGLRMLSDRPPVASDVLRRKRADYDATASTIREEIRHKYELAKIDAINVRRADRAAKSTTEPVQTSAATGADAETDTEPVQTVNEVTPDFLSMTPPPAVMTNGNGNGHKNGNGHR